jgi:hypothetical protein
MLAGGNGQRLMDVEDGGAYGGDYDDARRGMDGALAEWHRAGKIGWWGGKSD